MNGGDGQGNEWKEEKKNARPGEWIVLVNGVKDAVIGPCSKFFSNFAQHQQ